MITTQKIIPMIRNSCPPLDQVFDAMQIASCANDIGIYMDLDTVAEYVLSCCFEKKDTSSIAIIFEIVERCITEGDKQTRDAAIVGFIETLWLRATREPSGLEVILPWLGPMSRRGLAEVEDAWKGTHSLADVIRDERRAAGPSGRKHRDTK
ncbi:MAG: hypothetical protein WCB14_04495 [Candidatus Acidiferrales bacterium]